MNPVGLYFASGDSLYVGAALLLLMVVISPYLQVAVQLPFRGDVSPSNPAKHGPVFLRTKFDSGEPIFNQFGKTFAFHAASCQAQLVRLACDLPRLVGFPLQFEAVG
jgi:hypothetical protein